MAAGWGVYYLAVMASTSVGAGATAIYHFMTGYAWGSAVMARPLTAPLALVATFLSGGFTRVALSSGTVEWFFAWAGPLAAMALSDTSSPRNIAYSIGAFVAGFALLSLFYLF